MEHAAQPASGEESGRPGRLGFGSLGLLLGFLVLIGFLGVRTAQADPWVPPRDGACRTCHKDTDAIHTFPSGEAVPVQVDVAAVDASAHNAFRERPVLCTGCHTGPTRYRYPHPENPAESLAEFVAAVEANCQGCHYPHNPYHEELDADVADVPSCTDCHGSHDIAPVERIRAEMPARCVACHTDQPAEWAQDRIPYREGWGPGHADYAGSARCAGCHEEIYATWQATRHARLVQNVAENPAAALGDFQGEDPSRPFTLEDVDYVLGSRWKQHYIQRGEDGVFRLLPAQWNVATQEWVPYHPDDWQERDWRQECGTCHLTGLDTESWTAVEFGVGCESCHGPGEAHIQDPERVEMYAQVDDQVCGACHSRGTSPDGHPFPATYRPGDVLTDHFTFTTDPADVWPDGSARRNYQQYMDWQLGSRMARDPETSCTTCHLVHGEGEAPSQLRAPVNELCVECHADKAALYDHTPYHEEEARLQHEFTCVDCHMPLMATSAVPYDIHNHSFLQPNPQASIDHGGVEAMPNACNRCHTDPDETPQWAVRTIEYVKASWAPPVYRPGPTPTPAPPPTPIPSVGQPAKVVLQEQSNPIRTGFYVLVALLALIVLLVIVRLLWRVRRGNA